MVRLHVNSGRVRRDLEWHRQTARNQLKTSLTIFLSSTWSCGDWAGWIHGSQRPACVSTLRVPNSAYSDGFVRVHPVAVSNCTAVSRKPLLVEWAVLLICYTLQSAVLLRISFQHCDQLGKTMAALEACHHTWALYALASRIVKYIGNRRSSV